MGARVPFEEGQNLYVSLPSAAEITLVHNGRRMDSREDCRAVYEVSEAGVYRVEVRRGGVPWVFSNPICFEFAPPES